MVNAINFTMSLTIPMDKVGRVVLPKEVRLRLNLSGGDLLDADIRPDGVFLRPKQASTSHLTRLDGRAVWDARGASASAEAVAAAIERGRSERDFRASGL